MGCVPSSTASAKLNDKPSKPSSQSSAPQSKSKPKSRVSASSSREPAPSNPKYDTQVSASLVESGGSNVPFHGLLDDSGKLNLKRDITADSSNKLHEKACLPEDDANASSSFDSQTTKVTGSAMTMPYTIIVTSPNAAATIEDAITPVFDHANKVFNGWNPESEVSALNVMPPEKKIPLSPTLHKLLAIVDVVFDMTDGRYDPTTGVLSAAFENCISERKRPPLPSEIAPLKHAVGWKRRIVRTDSSIARHNAHTILDLDGMSKGFVIDRIVDALLTAGFADCYADWGGDVRAVGSHPDGSPWRCAVVRPPSLSRVFSHWQKSTLKDMLSSSDIAYYANLVTTGTNGCAIATSGDYFSMQKYGFHHIALTQDLTVMKASQRSVGSVCVIAKTCAMADAIATAGMTFDHVLESVQFLEALETKFPDVVFGHCVMGRHPSPSQKIERFSDQFFVPAERDFDDTPTASRSLVANVPLEESKKMAERVLKLVYQAPGVLHLNDACVKLDSLVSCSMDPHPLVTFMVPWSFLENVSESGNSKPHKARYVTLGSDRKASNVSGVTVDLRLVRVQQIGDSAFVGATIEDVQFGNVSECQIVHHGASYPYQVKLEMARSQFPLARISQKARVLLRHIPCSIWVVTSKSLEQITFALTATSVNVSRDGGGLVTFNVSHTSAFYAGLGGNGTVLQLYALSYLLYSLAQKYVTECQPSNEELAKLESKAVVAVSCCIESSENLQDHLVVVARLIDVRCSNAQEERRPLIWLAGRSSSGLIPFATLSPAGWDGCIIDHEKLISIRMHPECTTFTSHFFTNKRKSFLGENA